MKILYLIISIMLLSFNINSQNSLDNKLPVRAFYINGLPSQENLDLFVHFIDEVLAPHQINTIIISVGHNYKYKSHPELSIENSLGEGDVKKIVLACKKHDIHLIPKVNLLGHQSWANKIGKLLEVYPEFDETPHIKIPKEYKWPNDDGLYCKSYCPLHPEVHNIVFELVDEITEVFESNAFHAGMDEVFYIGDEKCPRCNGHDKAELFAGEINKIHNHLAQTGKELWIWGDRLLDGKTSGLGMWEASMNNTHRSIDLISKDVIICDWHYEKAEPTAAYFATKGFQVISCSWKKSDVAIEQLYQMINFRKNSSPKIKKRFRGIMQTNWRNTDSFLQIFYKNGEDKKGEIKCFNTLLNELDKISK